MLPYNPQALATYAKKLRLLPMQVVAAFQSHLRKFQEPLRLIAHLCRVCHLILGLQGLIMLFQIIQARPVSTRPTHMKEFLIQKMEAILRGILLRLLEHLMILEAIPTLLK
jgi:hypothetical protein